MSTNPPIAARMPSATEKILLSPRTSQRAGTPIEAALDDACSCAVRGIAFEHAERSIGRRQQA
jgi:hypothetical protein